MAGLGQGDLDSAVNFAFWVDDGDNVYEPNQGENNGHPETIFLQGPLSGIGQQGKITLADSVSSILGATVPIPGGTTFYIAKAWCFGTLASNGTTQDGLGTDGPLAPGRTTTGFTCDGANVNNAAQTDRVQGDLQFYAVQSRNNPNFTCANGYRGFAPLVP